MELGLRHRVGRGLLAQSVSQFFGVTIRFVEVPLLLAFWGTVGFGEWILIATGPTLLALLMMGYVSAVNRAVLISFTAGELAIARAVWRRGRRESVVIALFMITALSGVFWLTPVEEILGVVDASPNDAARTLTLIACYVPMAVLAEFATGAMAAQGDYPRATHLQTTRRVLTFLGLTAAVTLGGGIVAGAVGFVCGQCLGSVASIVVARRTAPWYHQGDIERVVSYYRVRKSAMASVLVPFAEGGYNEGGRIAIGVTLGADAVAVFATMMTLARAVQAFVRVVSTILIPELGYAQGRGDTLLFARLVYTSGVVSLWAGIVFALGIWLLGGWFLEFWTDGLVRLQPVLFTGLLVGAVLNVTWYSAFSAAIALNRLERIAPTYVVIYVVLGIALIAACAHFFGLTAIGLAALVIECLLTIIIVPMSLRRTGLSWQCWLKSLAVPWRQCRV